MTASFALSIILLLSLSVFMDTAGLLMPSQSPTSADFTLSGYANKMILERSMVDEIREIPGVKNAYGSNYRSDVPATSSKAGIDHINIVSYDDTLLDYAKGSIAEGDLAVIYGDSNKVATVFNKNNQLQVGDTIQISGEEVEVSCALSQGLFGDDLIVICSQKTYDRLMGKEAYGLIGVQLGKDATEKTAAEIRKLEKGDVVITDQRDKNRQDSATYYASRILCYGFLAIIGLIALFNIMNSISMSVSARIRQYGAMRAVGMDNRQLTRMIAAEAFTYAVSGLIVGFIFGIPLSRFLYKLLITRHFGVAWHLPVILLGIIILFVLVSAAMAVHAPARRMRDMAITDTINNL